MIDKIRPFNGFDYIQAGNPTIDVNPRQLGATWLNITTGEIFVCTSVATGSNMWAGQLGTWIRKGVTVIGSNSIAITPIDGSLVVDLNIPGLRADDMLYITYAVGSITEMVLDIENATLVDRGYYVGGSDGINLGAFYLFLTTNLTTITLPLGTGTTLNSGALCIFALRGVDKTNPIDVPGSSLYYYGDPDPSPITPITNDAIVICSMGNAHGNGALPYTSAPAEVDYWITTPGQNVSNDVVAGSGIALYTGSVVDIGSPGMGSIPTDSRYAMGLITTALRPSVFSYI